MAPPLLIAHRGASDEAPENTLSAFARALALGVDGVELDVRLTRDGIPVVFHDPSVAVPGHRRHSIARLDLADLDPIRLEGQPIPTLADALDLLRQRAIVQIEIKAGVSVAPVVRVVQDFTPARRIVLASFDATIVRAARVLAPRIPRMLISRIGSPLALAEAMEGLEVEGVSLDRRALESAAQVAALHDLDYRVWCWTVNRPAVMLQLRAWGVDALLSDRPALLVSTLLSAQG